jgi:intein/homing endonuclease|nr:MAG TPA: endonuclease [Caudoviricetes sp.]
MIEKEIIESYLNKGLTFKEIATELDVNYKTLLRYTKKYELKSGVGTQGARKHKFNEKFFEVIDSEEKAYWLGFIAADGCVYQNANAWRLQINLKGSDKNHLDKLQLAIGSTYKIAEKKIGKSDICQLKINSKILCDDLIKLGIIERKSLVVKMPDLDHELTRHFIRGYFDGDGNIKNFDDKNGRHRYNFNIVGGEEMLNSISESMPCDLDLYKVKRVSPIFSLETTSREKLKEIYDFLYKDATIYLNRKKDVFSNLMSRFAEMQGQ